MYTIACVVDMFCKGSSGNFFLVTLFFSTCNFIFFSCDFIMFNNPVFYGKLSLFYHTNMEHYIHHMTEKALGLLRGSSEKYYDKLTGVVLIWAFRTTERKADRELISV